MSVEVLFVDDEPDVLEGIENHLYAIRSSWRARFAHSGDEALALLDRRTADVVVSDMRMPGMDGATLLAKVRQQHPSAVRIILSGETGAKGFLRAAACAHQVLAKPCDIAALQRLVTETLALQRQLADPDLVAAINQLTVLPCLPAISARLEDVLRDERSFTQDVVDLLEQDPAIVCRILHVANSPFFRGAGEVTDLHSAVTRLGHDLIRGLVLSQELYARIDSAHPMVGELRRRHDDALRCAYIASMLAASDADVRLQFTAGVLYGVGSVERLCLPEPCGSRVGDGRLAGYLLSLWGLPTRLVQTVAFADRPSALPQPKDHPAVLLHVALTMQRRSRSASSRCWHDEPGFDTALLMRGILDEAWLVGQERTLGECLA